MVKIISKRRREAIYRQLDEEAEQMEKANEELQNLKTDDEWIEHILDQTTRDVGIVDVNYIQTEDC